MPDSSIGITPGTGAFADTRTQPGGDHRQVMVVGDPVSADVATTIADGFGGIGIGVAQMATNFVISVDNSSTAQLAGGATFNGAVETCFNQQAVSVLFVADQTCRITIRQWIDQAGTKKASEWSFTVVGGTGFSRCFVANGNFISFHVTNMGTATTTTLDLNVAYGTLPSATNLGNEPVALTEINGYALAGDPLGAVPVHETPTTLFYEDFPGALDTVNKWTTVGTAFTISNGSLTMPTTNVTGSMSTIPTFSIQSSQYFVPAWNVRLEATAATGTARFWGLASAPAATPSLTSLATEGAGFEIQSNGTLAAVTYTGGVRTIIATLARPTDNAYHRYTMHFRGLLTVWSIDGTEAARATNLDIATQTMRGHFAYFATGLSGVPQTQILAFGIGDRSRLHTYIADPNHPHRRASVTDWNSITGVIAAPGAGDRTLGSSMNVNTNALQKATYKFTVIRNPPANYVAGTTQYSAALWHTAAALRTVRIRRIIVSLLMPATAHGSRIEVHRVTAAPTGGTAVAAGAATATSAFLPLDHRNAAAESQGMVGAVTATSAGILEVMTGGAGAVLSGYGGIVYDWQESGETQPMVLRPGVLEGIAIGVTTNAAITAAANTTQVAVEITLTEE